MSNTAPQHHWYQFRLSTWFVLVAILCWGLSQWPFWEPFESLMVLIRSNITVKSSWSEVPRPEPRFGETVLGWKLLRIADRLRWPALALAGFVAFKLVAQRSSSQVAE